MRILFILHYPPPVHGSSVIGNYIKESHVINEDFNCRYINLGTSHTIVEIGRRGFSKLFRYMVLLWQVNKLLLTFRPDLCYFSLNSQGIGFYKDTVILLLVKILGVRPVYHFHNKGVRLRQNKVFDNLLYRIVFRKAEVILLSKYLYPDICKYVTENHVHYCPNGIPDRKELSAWGVKEGMSYSVSGSRYSVGEELKTKDSNVVRVLFLSHLIRSKGVLVMIDVCALLIERKLDFHCTIAGGAAEMTQEEVGEIIEEKGLEKYISVVGPKHNEEKIKLLESVDIFVHPSFNDCMPLILIESMQFKIPIVSTFEGAIPDIVENGVTGFLVPQKDAAALAEKLELLILNPELRIKMGDAGRAKYEREFTLERFERRMVEILEEVGGKK